MTIRHFDSSFFLVFNPGDLYYLGYKNLKKIIIIRDNKVNELYAFLSACHTIRYDTRCHFNVRSKADKSQLNLPHGTEQKN